MTELDWLQHEQLITSQKKSAEMSNAKAACLGEFNHAISIDQFPVFPCTLAAEQADVRPEFVKPTDRRVRSRQHDLTARF